MAEQAASFESIVADAAAKIGYQDAPEPKADELPAPAPESNAVEGETKAPDGETKAAPAETKEPKTETPPPPQTVPLAVHIRQRERYENEQRELRRQLQLGNERLNQIAESLRPQSARPDKVQDPLGYTISELDSVKSDVAQTRQMLEQNAQQQRVAQDVQNFRNWVVQDEQQFEAEHADFADAVKYAKDMKFREYTALGLPPQQAALRVQQDAFALAQHAAQQGFSPSDLAYRMAHALGYKPAANPAPAPAAPAAATVDANATVDMRAAGAQRQKSSGGNEVKSGSISLQELARMDNDEFAKMTAGKKWEKLFAGS